MPPERLYGWRAKRAGGRITIYGQTMDDQPRRVVGVDLIQAGAPHPIATDKDGRTYELVTPLF